MEISEYQVAWNIDTNVGKIRIKIEGQNQPKNIPLSNAAEFVAILSILQGDGTAYINNNGWIGSSENEI